MQAQTVAGLWDDTFFPRIKELAHYGADYLSKDNRLEDWVQAALDTAVVTLSTLAPELAPAAIAVQQLVQQPLKDKSEMARSALEKWSISGQRYPDQNVTA
jgi:hypothetical protein